MNNLSDEKKYESFLNMWRTLVSLTHLDNIVSQQEKALIQDFILNAKLEEEDRALLNDDLDQRHRPDEFIHKVNYPAHLSQLHHLANVLFRSDELDPKEEVFLKKILDDIEAKIGILNATTQSAHTISELNKNHVNDQEKGPRSVFSEIIRFFSK
ncbi:hypothetical protein M902_1103 [Bacteriovorax sp. BAL6_X]|uniref:DUF533 domain-containing protein n=1 Tax=Bacteriovorax sp. BAL6_X TaxID=1201290 RepID=UPI0003855C16|nr:hypothetical protein [Bacteriovorax sp. BAL6_X]EPZ49606.1 hypothetical protein M902_1103 [Bacteriovorax sp. BAL6_X]